jgi:acetyl-CoA synthetase
MLDPSVEGGVMAWATIHKPAATGVEPNVVDYDAALAGFTWADARAELDGLPGGVGLNIAHEAVDRWATGPTADTVALRCLARTGARRDLTYAQLKAETDRFAAVLGALDVESPDTVFLLLPRRPELYVAALGAMKARCPVSPLFPAFGPEPIRQRMALGAGRVLVTTEALYRRKVRAVREQLPDLAHVLLVDETGTAIADPGVRSLPELLSAAPLWPGIAPTDPEDVALLHFTSGTTGTPKGALHVHEAVVAHHSTGRIALDLHPGDVYWCTADPGWVTGMSYGIIAPLTNGVTCIVDERDFEADRWYRTLDEEHVTVWYTAPTAIRMLMRAGPELAAAHDLSRLRFVASVGEPLNPEAVVWGQEVLGRPVHDNWWQTETGGIMIANLACTDVKPGSMGRPLPGIEAAVLARDPERDGAPLLRHGEAVVVDDPSVEGHLALRPGWPSMFRGYLGEPERYQRCFVGGWYVSGDLVRRDADGYFWFVGRADDVIKSAGHLIGPFEVESALMEHPLVAEVGVIGVPDPVAGEIVKAFVSLTPGAAPSEELARELVGFARARLGPAVAPKSIAFDDQLPHTRSGKIMRRLLKARELGLPLGDTSTMENAP